MAPLRPPEQSRPGNIHVLVVEDDLDMRALVYDGLLLQGMTGDSAADGIGGLKLALAKKYDVVISDIQLPGLGGIDLARTILKAESAPKVILVTAYATPEVMKHAYAAGACRVLSKPVGLRALASVVHEVVGRSPGTGA